MGNDRRQYPIEDASKTRDKMPCEVRNGTQRDAVLYSVGANATHGKRRTNADKRKAVETLLKDREWAKWSNYEISRRCAVSADFVGRVRSSLSSNDSEPRTYKTKHGTTATMNTGEAEGDLRGAAPRDEAGR